MGLRCPRCPAFSSGCEALRRQRDTGLTTCAGLKSLFQSIGVVNWENGDEGGPTAATVAGGVAPRRRRGTVLAPAGDGCKFGTIAKAIADVREELETQAVRDRSSKAWTHYWFSGHDSNEAHKLLGTCEMSRGRTEAADAAWARSRPDSPFAASAIFGQIRSVRWSSRRFAGAEEVIRDAVDNPSIDGSSLPILLGLFVVQQGRLVDTLRLIEKRWDALYRQGEGASGPAIRLIRAHVDLRRSPIPTEEASTVLDEAGRRAPRRRSGMARQGQHGDSPGQVCEPAERWLADCLSRRPDDPSVWRARLEWAVRSNRVADSHEALRHIPADESTTSEVYKLSAWFARKRGDLESEQLALERAMNADPTDFQIGGPAG